MRTSLKNSSRLVASSSRTCTPWVCASCATRAFRSLLPRQLSPIQRGAVRTASSTSSKQHAYTSPAAEQLRNYHRRKNQTVMYVTSIYKLGGIASKSESRNYAISAVLATVALSYGSVPMYKMVCQQTGWGGQPVRSAAHGSPNSDPSTRLIPVEHADRIRVTFAGSTSDVLPWKFVPQQREVRVLPGETALAFYTATNQSEADIIGVATYSVTPGQVAPYFSKIQCFCFEEQRLNAGETVDMPVFFYIDPDFVNDPNMRGISTITLNYTFFKAKYDNNGRLTAVPLPQ